MIIINKKFTPNAFAKYVKNMPWRWYHRNIYSLVFHHTSSPVEIWQGSASMLHYYNLYRSRGWKVGPHIFIAPDGIWLFTDMHKQGKHAGPVGNIETIGIEVVGRYNDQPPTDPKMCKNIAIVTKALREKFPNTSITRHVDYDPNSFCSRAITKEWILDNLNTYYHDDSGEVNTDNLDG